MNGKEGDTSKIKISNENHQSEFAEYIITFFVKKINLDLVFICKGNIRIPVHKVIIASVSEYLASVMRSTSEDVLFINLPDVDPDILRIVINFLYEGVTELTVLELVSVKEVISLLGINFGNNVNIFKTTQVYRQKLTERNQNQKNTEGNEELCEDMPYDESMKHLQNVLKSNIKKQEPLFANIKSDFTNNNISMKNVEEFVEHKILCHEALFDTTNYKDSKPLASNFCESSAIGQDTVSVINEVNKNSGMLNVSENLNENIPEPSILRSLLNYEPVSNDACESNSSHILQETSSILSFNENLNSDSSAIGQETVNAFTNISSYVSEYSDSLNASKNHNEYVPVEPTTLHSMLKPRTIVINFSESHSPHITQEILTDSSLTSSENMNLESLSREQKKSVNVTQVFNNSHDSKSFNTYRASYSETEPGSILHSLLRSSSTMQAPPPVQAEHGIPCPPLVPISEGNFISGAISNNSSAIETVDPLNIPQQMELSKPENEENLGITTSFATDFTQGSAPMLNHVSESHSLYVPQQIFTSSISSLEESSVYDSLLSGQDSSVNHDFHSYDSENSNIYGTSGNYNKNETVAPVLHSLLNSFLPKRTSGLKNMTASQNKRQLCNIKIFCKHCKKKFTSKLELRLHSCDSHNKYKCTFCYASFKQNYNLKAHMRLHNLEKPFECNVCHKTFTQKVHFKKHYETHIGNSPPKASGDSHVPSCMTDVEAVNYSIPLACESENVLSPAYELELTKSSEVVFKDNAQEGLQEMESGDIIDIISPEHLQNNDFLITSDNSCLRTEGTFLFNNTNIDLQNESFHQDLTYCKQCKMTFTSIISLQSHRCDLLEKYKCRFCKKSFKYNSFLKLHERIHQLKKPFECNVCHKKFTQEDHLSRHYETHLETTEDDMNNEMLTYSNREIFVFEKVYRRNAYPSEELISKLSQKLGIPIQRVNMWFKNKKSKDMKEYDTQSASSSAVASELSKSTEIVAFHSMLPMMDSVLESQQDAESEKTICLLSPQCLESNDIILNSNDSCLRSEETVSSVYSSELSEDNGTVFKDSPQENPQVLEHRETISLLSPECSQNDDISLTADESHLRITDVSSVLWSEDISGLKLKDREKTIHQAVRNKSKMIVCERCTRKFISEQTYNLHSCNSDKTYQCSFCDASFDLIHHKIYHERIHMIGKRYVCDICKAKFFHKIGLRRHIRSTHENGGNSYEEHGMSCIAQS